jgi:hypothetical protein
MMKSRRMWWAGHVARMEKEERVWVTHKRARRKETTMITKAEVGG